jgi:hypothetical protein
MRGTGHAVIGSLIRPLPTVPLPRPDYDLATRKQYKHNWLAPWLSNAAEDMHMLVGSYAWERPFGHDNLERLAGTRRYVDKLPVQQQADNSWPRRWYPSSHVATEPRKSSVAL